MIRRFLPCATTALALAIAGNAAAESAGPYAVPMPSLPGHALTDTGSVIVAQAGDPRVTQLEEQVRQLNGLVEELNFQILQMQEQIRKMQEDNEFRLQQLEERSGIEAPDGQATASSTPSGGPSLPNDSIDMPTADQGGSADRGAPPRNFGTITFDADGNASGAGLPDPSTDDRVAALPQAGSEEEAYRNAYEFILSGDYPTAEAGFRDYLDTYPDGNRAADANFWLGEALLGQNKPRDAAEVFLAASRDYPQSSKAPDMLLKLGISLAAMNQKEIACATFQEIGQRYPDASSQLKERVERERQTAGC
ncbi:MAG: tol-pal system protein YbgF [Rhizobiaceae bacterium]|nr:tol-pal system protein YbgF [Rhizobiaceae bacterium]MCV0408741.1 tol-pal system protein YbgF [Rhizobiaceae bacterium]